MWPITTPTAFSSLSGCVSPKGTPDPEALSCLSRAVYPPAEGRVYRKLMILPSRRGRIASARLSHLDGSCNVRLPLRLWSGQFLARLVLDVFLLVRLVGLQFGVEDGEEYPDQSYGS